MWSTSCTLLDVASGGSVTAPASGGATTATTKAAASAANVIRLLSGLRRISTAPAPLSDRPCGRRSMGHGFPGGGDLEPPGGATGTPVVGAGCAVRGPRGAAWRRDSSAAGVAWLPVGAAAVAPPAPTAVALTLAVPGGLALAVPTAVAVALIAVRGAASV